MYTKFNNVKKPNNPSGIINMDSLIEMIRNNPKKEKIELIRSKAISGDDSYKIDKERYLSCITPFGIFQRRNDNNMVASSGYIYLDIDDFHECQTVHSVKAEIIEKYGNLISMCCYSCSGKGLTIFVKTDPILSKNNIKPAIEYVKSLIPGFMYDKRIKDISRAWFVSQDEDVFYNPNSFIKIPDSVINKDLNEKETFNVLMCGLENTLNVSFSQEGLINIDDLLKEINLSTPVDTLGEIYRITPVEFCKVYIPKIISNDSKRKTYSAMIHQLMFINPDITRNQVLSFLNYVNSVFAKPRMEFKQMARLVDGVMKYAKEQELMAKTKIKNVHFAKDCGLNGKQKRNLAAKLNGGIRMEKSIEKIMQTMNDLNNQGVKVTQKNVSALAGISLKTVNRHWDKISFELEPVPDVIIGKEATNQPEVSEVHNEEVWHVEINSAREVYTDIVGDKRYVDNGGYVW